MKETFASYLRILIQRNKLSQRELARRAEEYNLAGLLCGSRVDYKHADVVSV